MITITDIAALAGVSKSTVSRVLTGAGYVNDETREKIEKIIKEYGYQPSESARSLSKKTTNTIGVVVPEIDNSFYSEVLNGIGQIVDENNYNIIYFNTNNSIVKEEKALQMLKAQRVRGVILAAAVDYSEPEATENLKQLLEKINAPVVLLDREIDGINLDKVVYDNFGSAFAATEALIKAGNKTIGIITGDLNLKHARDRYEGYLQAMNRYQIPIIEKYIMHGDFMTETAYSLAGKMYDRGDIPDGIVSCNNRTTLGFLRATRERNMKLGREIAFVGIDHIDVLDIIDYKYSYVSRDTVEMGRIAMELLIERIRNPKKYHTVKIVPYELFLKGAEKKMR